MNYLTPCFELALGNMALCGISSVTEEIKGTQKVHSSK